MTTSDPLRVESLFRELLPSSCAVIAAPLAKPAPPLLPEELAAAKNMVDKRQREFAVGRDCARRALLALGHAKPVPIPVGDGRAPLWPEGYAGSITHSAEVAAAAVTARRDHASLGIDLEIDAALEPELIPRICLPAEAALLNVVHPVAGNAGRMFFSMKESAYKCLWPVTRQFLEFHDLEVVVDTRQNTFRVRLQGHAALEGIAHRLRGRWARSAGWVTTIAWLEGG